MVSAHDRAVLGELARRKLEIASLPRQGQIFEAWGRLNALKPIRPMVWINEVCWHELNVDGSLTPRCQDPFLRGIEAGLRQELHQWEHFGCDMVVEPVIYCGIVAAPTSSYADYGLVEKPDKAAGGQDVSYTPIIDSPADADRIATPRVWFDREATARNLQTLREAVGDILPVRQRGLVHQWHAMWDQIIHWYGVERLYIDMYDRPALVHRVLANFSRALGEVVDRQIELGMLDVGNGNWRVGSGGMGIIAELPSELPAGTRVQPAQTWGCGAAQIFSEVSPEMHEEFSLQYERPLMERYGLTYYGCCDQLHKKIDMLRSVRNLRKISVSPWADTAEASAKIGRDFVASFKPNPALLAGESFDEALVRNYMRKALNSMRTTPVEIILKDLTTVRNDPSRIDRWARITMELVEDYAY